MSGTSLKINAEFLYYVEKMTYSIPTTFIGMTYATSIPTTVVGTDIPTELVGTVYLGKSCGGEVWKVVWGVNSLALNKPIFHILAS